MPLTLQLDSTPLTIHRYPADATLDPKLTNVTPLMLTRTPEELSVVCPQSIALDSDAQEGPWVVFAVEGPLDFSLTGILAQLSQTLAEAEISIFAVSTFDTDLILVRAHEADAAVTALTNSGYQVRANKAVR